MGLGERVVRGGADGLAALAHLLTLAEGGSPAGLDAHQFVPALLALRERARRDGLYAFADDLRDLLVNAGVEVHDEPAGPTWTMRHA